MDPVNIIFDIEYNGFTFRCVGVRRSHMSFHRVVDFHVVSGTGSEYDIIEEISDLDIELLGSIKANELAYDSVISRIRAFQMTAAMESMGRLWGFTD